MLYNKLRKHITDYVEIQDAELDSILNSFTVIKYPAKTYILKKGQVCNFIGFVNEGCLEFSNKIQKKEQVINFPKENWWIGDLNSLLNQTPSNFYFKTIEDTELLILNKDNFVTLIENHKSFLLYYLKITQGLYRDANEQYALALALSAEERYDTLLADSPDLISRIPDKYLASYLGIRPPSLSRIKRKKIKKTE